MQDLLDRLHVQLGGQCSGCLLAAALWKCQGKVGGHTGHLGGDLTNLSYGWQLQV